MGTWKDHDLYDACWQGNLAEVKQILLTHCVNSRGYRGKTPVNAAAEQGHREVVEYLVSRGADVSLVDNDGNNILHYACLGGDTKTVEFVLSLGGVDINRRGQESRTQVMAAARRGQRDVVKLLVSQGADVSLVDDAGNNILHYACMGGDSKTVEFVLSVDGVDINSRGLWKRTPVMWAACEGHKNVVEFLVSQHADVSLVDNVDDNILHWACRGGDRKTVEFVLSLDGVDSNKRGRWSKTPVMLAAVRGHKDAVELLVTKGLDVSLVDDDGNNILHWACMGGDRKTVEFVHCQNEVDIRAKNKHGQTAADLAKGEGHQRVVDFLMSSGGH